MLVSILIPCHNAERWIGQCIDSALAQDWPDTEVIVVDDGSTDGSSKIIQAYAGRIRWESTPNRGSNSARNRLLELAKGEWLQYLDADDYLQASKVSSQLRDAPAADVLFGPVTLEHWSEHGSRLAALPIPEPHDPWVLLVRWFLPQTGAALWRRAAVTGVGGWRVDQAACQEHRLYLQLLLAGKRFAYRDAGGAVYRQWSDRTLWTRDRPRQRALRLAITDEAEAYLRSTGQLTAARHWAINQGRFELARTAWHHDRSEARAIVAAIERSDAGFVPGGVAAPPAYRLLYRSLGFAPAETLAGWRRRFTGRGSAA